MSSQFFDDRNKSQGAHPKQEVTLDDLLSSSDLHRSNNDFKKALSILEQALELADQPSKKSHVYMRIGRMHNGTGAYYLKRNDQDFALKAYENSKAPLEQSLKIAVDESLGALTEKAIVLQQYFTATGLYKIDSSKKTQLVTARKDVQDVIERTLKSLEKSSIVQESLLNPEAGSDLSTTQHELAFIIDDRPEGEDLPLSDQRKSELERSVSLYSKALKSRKGKLAAMTFSRRLSPTYKLGGVSAALSDLEKAVDIYIAKHDGQRLDILERDIKKLHETPTITIAEKEKLSKLLDIVERANIT